MSVTQAYQSSLIPIKVKWLSLAGATPPHRRPLLPCQQLMLPRQLSPHRRRAKARASLSRRPTTAHSRPSWTQLCHLVTATQVCPTTQVCPACPAPSSTAPPCSYLLLLLNSTAWAWATPPHHSSSPVVTASTPLAQVSHRRAQSESLIFYVHWNKCVLCNSCSGYDDLTQGPAGAEYSKGYSNSSQTQAKSAASGPGKGAKRHTWF